MSNTLKITQIAIDEFKIVYNGETWYSAKNGDGSIPEKYWDTKVEETIKQQLKEMEM